MKRTSNNRGLSNIIGVILMILIIIIASGFLTVIFYDIDLTQGGEASVKTIGDNEEVLVVSMGKASKIEVRHQNNTVKNVLTESGHSAPIEEGDIIVGIGEYGAETVLLRVEDN